MLEALLAQLNSEEERSRFRLLYETYLSLMICTAQKTLADPRDVEEAVNEAFFRISEHFSKIKEILCPQTRNLVVIITRNASIDILRKNGRQVPLTDPSLLCNEEGEAVPLEELASDQGTGVAKLFDGMMVQDAMEVILGLPEKVRDTMYLCYAEDLDAEEIAALLGITKDAVYKRLQRGLIMLRERLGEDD